MAQVGGIGFFLRKNLKKKLEMQKKKYVGALTYLRMLTDLRQVLDVTGSGAKMAQMGGNGVFFETVEKDMEIKIEKMIITLKW